MVQQRDRQARQYSIDVKSSKQDIHSQFAVSFLFSSFANISMLNICCLKMNSLKEQFVFAPIHRDKGEPATAITWALIC